MRHSGQDEWGRKTRPKNIMIVLSAAVVIAALATAYAATSLSVNNTATIVAGNPNLFMVTGATSTTACSASTGSYTDTGLAVAWGSVQQGLAYSQYVCLENTGSPHTLAVTNTLPSPDGTLAATIGGTTASGQTIGHNSFALITFTWTVDPSAPPTTTLSFTISVS